jgi:MFS family permease
VIAATLSPLLAADTVSLAIYFKRTLTDMALLTGYHLLGVGLAGFIFVPSARIWGKRHLYLLGTIIVVVSSAWGGGNGRSYKSLLWARIFQGIGLAPFEALVNASVGDLYHVHERGVRMALSNLALFGGAFFTPVLVGKIADTLGYQWTFYFVAIFAAAMFPLLFFFVPETTYRREERFDIDTMGNLVQREGIGEEGKQSDVSTSGPVELDATTPPTIPEKVTWKQSLAPFNGRKSDERYLHLLLRPFPLFFHPVSLQERRSCPCCQQRCSAPGSIAHGQGPTRWLQLHLQPADRLPRGAPCGCRRSRGSQLQPLLPWYRYCHGSCPL